MRIFGAVLLSGVAVLRWAAPAAASCLGPTVEHQGEVVRGTTFVVTGRGWGDNCYDTGGPPEGEGTLGRPVTDIEVVISQAGQEIVVARGSANWDYNFFVEVEVPVDLQPGVATVFARSEQYDTNQYDDNRLLLVSEASASPMSGGPLPTFVTSGEPTLPDFWKRDEQSWTDRWPGLVIPAVVGAAAGCAMGWWVGGRRQAT